MLGAMMFWVFIFGFLVGYLTAGIIIFIGPKFIRPKE